MSLETNQRAATRRQLSGLVNAAMPGLLPQPTGQANQAELPVATLDSIRAVFKKPVASEEMPGEWWSHPVFGKMRIGPMTSEGYSELIGVPVYNSTNGRSVSLVSKDDRQRNLIYLHRGILEPQLTPDDAKAILDRQGCGVANLEMISAIRRWNPPIDDRLDELKMAIGSNAILLMAWRVLREFKLLPELAKILDATEPLSESQEGAKLAIEAVLERMYHFETLFNIEEIAEKQKIPLTQAGAIEAVKARERAKAALAENVLSPVG